jgi:hypothetical protein
VQKIELPLCLKIDRAQIDAIVLVYHIPLVLLHLVINLQPAKEQCYHTTMFSHVRNKVVIGKQYVLLTGQNSVITAHLVGHLKIEVGYIFSLKEGILHLRICRHICIRTTLYHFAVGCYLLP